MLWPDTVEVSPCDRMTLDPELVTCGKTRAGGSLTAALEDLERSDPAVADAAAKLEQAKREILAGGSYRTRARRAIAERRRAGEGI